MIRNVVFAAAALSLAGCATLTSDAMTPVALSFSDGSSGNCQLTNKRGAWSAPLPATTMVRRSDDPLQYSCRSKDGRIANGQMKSTVGAKIVASAVFIDLGITDAITDKHREYPASFVIPLQARAAASDSHSKIIDVMMESVDDDAESDSVTEVTAEAVVESSGDSSSESGGSATGGGLMGGATGAPKGGMMGGAANDSGEN